MGGGRHMMGMLKYYMSYRQYNLMDQELLMRNVFERLSYVSMDTEGDLKKARLKPSGRRFYDRDFVLPDYTNSTKGKIRIPFALQKELKAEEERKRRQQQKQIENDIEKDDDDEDEDEDFEEDEEDDDDDDDDDFEEDGEEKYIKGKRGHNKQKRDTNDDDDCDNDDDEEEENTKEKKKRLLQQRAEEDRRRREQQEEEQVLRVSVERFVIPEVLFRPIDSGLQSDLVGLSEAIVQSVESCPEPYRPALYRS